MATKAAKHTPRPWTFTSDGDGKPFAVVTSAHEATGPDADVCEVYGGNDDCDETREANVIVGAAPDLLEALLEAEKFFVSEPNLTRDGWMADTLRAVRSALAKARGEG